MIALPDILPVMKEKFSLPLRFLLLFVLLFAFGKGSAQAQNGKMASLKVLSWNIYMLPPLAKITGKRQRAEVIADLLRDSDWDILVFQEAFHPAARRRLSRGLAQSFPYGIGPANRKFSIRTNSGIWMLSRHPIKELGVIDYEECQGLDDCFARKGSLLVEMDFHGKTIQVLGTHLQAGGPQSIRHSQYEEMRILLDAHAKPGIPQLVCGDMNTNKAVIDHYEDMLATLDAEDGPFIGPQQFTADGQGNDLCGSKDRSVIDYIFLRRQGASVHGVKRWIPRIRQRWSSLHQDLSDHNPVAIELDW